MQQLIEAPVEPGEKLPIPPLPTRPVRWPLYFVLAYLLLFLIWPPHTLFISDEVDYFEQALAFSEGQRYLQQTDPVTGLQTEYLPSQYPPGTSLLLAGLYQLGGKKTVFLLGLCSLVFAFLLVVRLLQHWKYDPIFALVLFVYPPSVLLSRSLMSDMPSLLIVTVGISLFFSKKLPATRQAGFLGAIAGLSLLFRETNLLILAPLLVALIWRGRTATVLSWAVAGFLLGLLPRLLLAQWLFGDPFFTKDPGVYFHPKYMLSNAPLYLGALMFFVPAGLWTVYRYRGPDKYLVRGIVGLFFLFYLNYGYNGCLNSGLKCLILGPRFFIPLLPFFALAGADFFQKQRPEHLKVVKAIYLCVAFVAISITTLSSVLYGQSQRSIIQQLHTRPTHLHVMDLQGDLSKYINQFYRPVLAKDVSWLRDTQAVKHWLEEATPIELHLLLRYENETRRTSSNNKLHRARQLMAPYLVQDSSQITLWDGSQLTTWKIVALNHQ